MTKREQRRIDAFHAAIGGAMLALVSGNGSISRGAMCCAIGELETAKITLIDAMHEQMQSIAEPRP